jgi:hypothetical protein
VRPESIGRAPIGYVAAGSDARLRVSIKRIAFFAQDGFAKFDAVRVGSEGN